jgi:hypothetical protein
VDLGGGGGHLVSDATVPTLVRIGDGGITRVETGPANDTIIGGTGRDEIFSGAGDDLIIGGAGTRVMDGQAGNDTIIGFSGHRDSDSFLVGEDGDDTLRSFNHHDNLDGGPGFDRLFLLAGPLSTALHGEDITIAVDSDQPQTDGFSCGPNSGSRFLRSYGIDVSYDTLRHKVKTERLLSKLHLGTSPSALFKALRKFKSDLDMETNASLQNLIDFLRSGKPAVALVAPSKRRLHYIVLNGFDLDSGTIKFVDTNGAQGSMSFAEFNHQWTWENQFKGIVGRLERLGLKILGLRTRTFLA